MNTLQIPIPLENESRLREFYLSNEPETTLKYPLRDYMADIFISTSPGHGGLGMILKRNAKAGDLLFVENALVTCACVREYARYTKGAYSHAPKHWWSHPAPRIPEEVHKHLATKFAKELELFTAPVAEQEKLIRSLDARPLDTPSGVDTNFLQENRGPWKTPGMRDLDTQKVWNIVANNAMCDKVRSTSHEEPMQVETCDLWGLWRVTPFINHSCDPNCHRMRVGDALILRAAINIESGEELTLPYFDIFEPLMMRAYAASLWGFRCECDRCAFESSIGKPYDAIQGHIVNLKRQIHSAASFMDVKKSRGTADRLMEKLAELRPNVLRLIGKLSKNSWEDEDVSFALDKTRNPAVKGWISASCVEPFIAFYALCETRSSRLSSDPVLVSSPINPTAIQRRTMEARHVLRKIVAIQSVLDISKLVNPGNLLGQEFHSILFAASKELAEVDVNENLAVNMAVLKHFMEDGIQFLSRFYGFPGEDVLVDLLVAQS